jgi:hypothetical protein
MAMAKIRREFLAVVMESPSYFSAPLQMRSGSRNIFSQKSVHYRLPVYNQCLIGEECYLKIGEFDKNPTNLSL